MSGWVSSSMRNCVYMLLRIVYFSIVYYFTAQCIGITSSFICCIVITLLICSVDDIKFKWLCDIGYVIPLFAVVYSCVVVR